MGLDFTEEDTVGTIADGLRREQGDGFLKALQYVLLDKLGIPLKTSENYVAARNDPSTHNWLKMAGHFGPRFANPTLALIGFKLVPLDGSDIDASELADIKADTAALYGKIEKVMDGAGKPKLREVGK